MTPQWRLPLPGDQDELSRRHALAAEYDAEFSTVGRGLERECIAYIPRVRLAPGPCGVRSLTVHAPCWGDVLDALDGYFAAGPDG